MRSKGIKTPALVIALGTTASKSVRELCQHMLSMGQDDRDAMAIVTIDTDTARPEFRDLLEDNPGKFHAFHVPIRVPANVEQADRLDRVQRSQVFMPGYIPRYYDYGAGGIRNHGHVALAYNVDKLNAALQDALASIKVLPTGQGHRVTDSVQVYMVGFLGGGTGSGIVADVGVVVRNMLATELQGQRLLLFGILPCDRMPGSGYNEESWRKSNSTAALLEVMATGMAATGVPGSKKEYRKRILDRVYLIPEGPIFNEMYVVGRTNLNDVDLVAEMVGLDLFQRITDASGVGDIERSQSPDFRNLKDKDDRLLYTSFSASCPIEVRFPTLEACDAFAHVAAGRLLQLPDFVGEVPPEYAPTQNDYAAWQTKWQLLATPSTGTTGSGDAALFVDPLYTFDADIFKKSSSTQRAIQWDIAMESIKGLPAQLDLRRKRILKRETDELSRVPAPDPDNPFVSYNARRLVHLSKLRAEYAYELNLFEQDKPDPPAADRNSHLENRLERILPGGLDFLIPGPIRDSMEQGRAQEVADYYTGVVQDAFYFQRHSMLTEVLRQLHQRADDLYNAGKRDIADADAIETGEKYVIEGERSTVWLGKLGKDHPHQIGLFDIAPFRRLQQQRGLDKLPAMVGLFRWATGMDDDSVPGVAAKWNSETFDKVLREKWMDRCRDYLNNARRQDRVSLAGANLNEAELQDALAIDAARMPERVLEFFREQYREKFETANLFDLLATGYAAETGRSRGHAYNESVTDLLREHLEHANNILRDMISADNSLWLEGPKNVRRTLYLGINWRKGSPEKAKIDAAAGKVSFAGKAEKPQAVRDLDPHRMQLNYASHALSIRTMPLFFKRHNSLTDDYITYEYAWRAGWEPAHSHSGAAASGATVGSVAASAFTQTAHTTYGEKGMPVHSCEEMERLTLDPGALPNRWKINLVQRILRGTHDTPQEPDWDLQDSGGDDPFGDPGAWDDDQGGHNGYNGDNPYGDNPDGSSNDNRGDNWRGPNGGYPGGGFPGGYPDGYPPRGSGRRGPGL